MKAKQRLLLTDRQCNIFKGAMVAFGYKITFDEVRRIADAVHAGTHSESDPVAIIMCNQIDEAQEAVNNRRKPNA